MALSSSDGLLWGSGPMRVGGLGPSDCLAPGTMFVPINFFVNNTKEIPSKSPNNCDFHHCWDSYWRHSLRFGNWSLRLYFSHQGPAAATEVSIPELFRKPTLLFSKTL